MLSRTVICISGAAVDMKDTNGRGATAVAAFARGMTNPRVESVLPPFYDVPKGLLDLVSAGVKLASTAGARHSCCIWPFY